MKITFLAPILSPSGGCRVIAIYTAKLIELGHEVTVVARAPHKKSLARGLIDKTRGVKPLSPDRKRFFDKLTDHVQEFHRDGPPLPEDLPDADVLIATWWRTAFEANTMPPEKGKKAYFVQGHEVFPSLPWDISGGSYYLPLQKITISRHLRDVMANTYGDKDVPVVENSVDLEQFFAPERQRNTRPTVGLLYSPSPVKGLDVNLKALKIAQEKFPDLRVVAFGTGPLHPDFPLPSGSDYHQLPPQDKIRDLYAQCDVWLCGSRTEGFHLPLLEAMACRTPVVTTRIGGAVEAVQEGVNGYIVDIEDSQGLADGLCSVLGQTPADWEKMSKAAAARARAYSWDEAAQRFETVLQEIANRS